MARREDKQDLDSNAKSLKKEQAGLVHGDFWALVGGLLAVATVLVGQWFIGRIYSGSEARNLLEAMINSALWLGGSVVTASATILALMLTMLSLSDQSKIDFDKYFFKRIEQIGILTTISLA